MNLAKPVHKAPFSAWMVIGKYEMPAQLLAARNAI
jgi:hypothetical protein